MLDKVKKYACIFGSFVLLVGLCVVPSFASSGGNSVLQVDSSPALQSTLELTETTETTILSVSANSTSGLHSLVLSLIGDYNPIVTDHTYNQGSGYTYHEIDIEPDWSWIASACIFAIVLYSVFRIIGIVLGGFK